MRVAVDTRRFRALVVAAAALAVMWPTIAGVFLFDDAPVVRDNPLLAAPSLRAFFGGNVFGSADGDLLFRPLLLCSLAVDRALLGNHALAMHAVNVLLHALASALVFAVLAALVDDARRALAAALLFAVHPVHLDAVAFIVNRSELLALAFGAVAARCLVADAGWRAWLRDEPAAAGAAPRWSAIAAAALALGAALLCKETAAGLLAAAAVLAIVRVASGRRMPASVVAGFAAFAVVFTAYAIARRHALGGFGGDAAAAWIADRRAAVLVPTVARIFADYVRLVVAPLSLRVDYSDYAISTTLFDPRALVAYTVHAAVAAAAVVAWRRGRRDVTTCIAAFYAALLPVSHLVPFREILAERFLYIPSVFACALAACVRPRRAVWLVVALYGLVTLAEATHFHSGEALWTTMVERAPQSARAQYNLGTVELEAGRCDRALPHFETAVQLLPAYAHAWTNLGECRVAVGDDARAGDALATAARLDGGNPRAWRNLARWRALHGDPAGARDALGPARSLAPDAPQNRELEQMIESRSR
jgi:tetratricopeptide (TPR) repeat protein